jgi:hypothetical protein
MTAQTILDALEAATDPDDPRGRVTWRYAAQTLREHLADDGTTTAWLTGTALRDLCAEHAVCYGSNGSPYDTTDVLCLEDVAAAIVARCEQEAAQ